MSARGPELLPDIIFDIDPALAPATPSPSISNIGPENVKQSSPATEAAMSDISHRNDQNVKQSAELVFVGVRLPSKLLDEIDAIAARESRGLRSEIIRSLLQFALD